MSYEQLINETHTNASPGKVSSTRRDDLALLLSSLEKYAEKLTAFREGLDHLQQRKGLFLLGIYLSAIVTPGALMFLSDLSQSLLFASIIAAFAVFALSIQLLLNVSRAQKSATRFAKHMYWVVRELLQTSSQFLDHNRDTLSLTEQLAFQLRLIELEAGHAEMYRLLKKVDSHFEEEHEIVQRNRNNNDWHNHLREQEAQV